MALPHLKYRIEFCQNLIDHMAAGYSYTTWGVDPLGDGSVSICSSTMYLWEEQYPEWLAAKKEGYKAGMKFFENLLVEGAAGCLPEKLVGRSKGINLSGVIFALKTRFHKEYGEPKEETSDLKDITISYKPKSLRD